MPSNLRIRPEPSRKASPGTGRKFTVKTLQLNFWRPGDTVEENEEEIATAYGWMGIPTGKGVYSDLQKKVWPSTGLISLLTTCDLSVALRVSQKSRFGLPRWLIRKSSSTATDATPKASAWGQAVRRRGGDCRHDYRPPGWHRFHSRRNVGCGKDYTLLALIDGKVKFDQEAPRNVLAAEAN